MSGNLQLVTKMQERMEQAKSMKDEEKLYRYNGVLYPTIMCPEENMKALDSISARGDDIMLVAYPKCGFNWMVGVVRQIITEATGVASEPKGPPLIEFFGPDIMKNIENAPAPRFLGTHMHNIPATFYEKKCKIMVIFRNPKDTLVSYYHFCNNNPVLPTLKSWDSFFNDFMSGDVGWGSYFEHAKAWEKKMDDPNVMIVTYEDIKQNLSEGVRQISTFFGFPLSDAQVEKISQGSTFNAMKEKSANSHGGMGNVIFRKGQVGDWKNHFTEQQNQQMDEAFKKHLEGTRIGALLKYQQHCV
uniref:Sulfotransferase n=1 Tax=Neogobius melanostomus TaxID=47308 RepID=A0A8C6V0D5_9GOBI